MLRFRHGSKLVELPPGAAWSATARDDHYRDTPADQLRGIIAAVRAGRPWRDVVIEQYAGSHPWLCRIITDPSRDLFLRQHPVAAGSAVLDVGAGWGQYALPLARRDGVRVTALEPTPERLDFIRAAAEQEGTAARMHFLETGLQEVAFEPSFDLVLCIGVLEWVPKFSPGGPRDAQVGFLRRLRDALRDGGRCMVGIENRLGLKYLLGARDDHTGQRNVNVLDAGLAAARHEVLTGQPLRVFTYTLAEYEEMFREAGFREVEAHGAFPDYKLPALILPCAPAADFNRALGEAALPPEHDGQDGHALEHPEAYHSHYRSLARLGVAQCFCPSYFFVLR